jgi:hypothetical protein
MWEFEKFKKEIKQTYNSYTEALLVGGSEIE